MNQILPAQHQPSRWHRAHAAETLAEVLIAFLVVGIFGTAATMILTQAIDVNKEAEGRLMAYNLAREGVEAIRNIRDTNWLRFPGDRENCWNVMLDTTSSLDCPTAVKIGSSSGEDYLVYPEVWDNSRYMTWNLDAIDPAVDDTSVFELSLGGSPDLILSTDPDCVSVWTCPETHFHRYVTVVSEDTDGDLLADRLQVTSTVTWEESGVSRTVTVMDELTNY